MQLNAITDALASIEGLGSRVLVASSLDSALEAVKPFNAWPCVVVFGLRENAAMNELGIGSGPRHRVTVTLRLLTLARDVSDARGQAAMQQLDGLRTDIKSACLGLVPDTGHEPLEYSGGQLAHASAGTVAFIDEFTSAYYLIHNPN